MISIIICSRSPELLQKVTASIKNTVGIPYEIIAIDNSGSKMGICEVYNRGAAKARYGYLCFSHEDIIFHTQDWGHLLISHFETSKARLIGILGSVIKTKTHSSVHIPFPKLNRHNQLQRYANNETDYFYENPNNEERSEVCVLDGLFIAATKKLGRKQNFQKTI